MEYAVGEGSKGIHHVVASPRICTAHCSPPGCTPLIHRLSVCSQRVAFMVHRADRGFCGSGRATSTYSLHMVSDASQARARLFDGPCPYPGKPPGVPMVIPYDYPTKPSMGTTAGVIVDGKFMTEAMVSYGRPYSYISEGFFRLLGPDKTLLPVPENISGANFIGACWQCRHRQSALVPTHERVTLCLPLHSRTRCMLSLPPSPPPCDPAGCTHLDLVFLSLDGSHTLNVAGIVPFLVMRHGDAMQIGTDFLQARDCSMSCTEGGSELEMTQDGLVSSCHSAGTRASSHRTM
jgi:hypothetical protein